MKRKYLPLFLALFLSCSLTHAMDLKDWKADGDVTLDSTRAHTMPGASIKVAPGAKVIKTLRTENGSGRVTLWFMMTRARPPPPRCHGWGRRGVWCRAMARP